MGQVMKQRLTFLLFFLFFTIIGSVIFPAKAMAAEEQKIFDEAGFLTDKEIADLEKLADKYSEKRDVNIFVSTIDSDKEADIEGYSDWFIQQHPGKSVVLSINIATRKVDVSGSNEIRKMLETERCELIREKITPDLTAENYFDAFSTYIHKTYQYLNVNPNINPESIFLKTWFQAIIALIIGGISVGIMAYSSGGKVTINQGTYLDTAHSRVVHKRDNYVRTVTTKVKKPESSGGNGHSGRSGGGGGGNSHSSGSF